jgi:hypothetical protein
MTDAAAIAAVLFGSMAVVFGLFSNSFHASIRAGDPGKKRLPKWWGRLWFLGFATVMFYLALNHFLGKK